MRGLRENSAMWRNFLLKGQIRSAVPLDIRTWLRRATVRWNAFYVMSVMNDPAQAAHADLYEVSGLAPTASS
jgi:hypothetical protein